MKHWLLILAVVLPALLLTGIRSAALSKGQEATGDSFWHAAAAELPFSKLVSKQFPLQMSLWSDRYSDKDLGFHVLLKGVLAVQRRFGGAAELPLNGFMFLLYLGFSGAFVLAGRRMGLSPPAILFGVTAAAVFLPNFTYRLFMLRPQVLSIALMMVAYAILAKGPTRRACLGIFLLGMVYSWVYSSPHLLWVTAFLFGLGYWRPSGFKTFLPFLSSVAGVFAGLTVHPQFPNSFRIWKVQAFDALLAPVSGGPVRLPFATELMAPAASWLFLALPAFALFYFCMMIVFRSVEKKCWKELDPNAKSLFFAAGFWTAAMAVVSLRPVEYAVPALILAVLLLLKFAVERKLFAFCLSPKRIAAVGLVLLTLCGTWSLYKCYSNLLRWSPSVPSELAAHLRKIAKPGARIANVNWSDFPRIYYAAPEYVYTWCLDPMFSYAADPGRALAVGAMNFNGGYHSSRRLRQLTGAEFAVVMADPLNNLGDYLERYCGWRAVYRDPSGWIFKLR